MHDAALGYSRPAQRLTANQRRPSTIVTKAHLVLEDGSTFEGEPFGALESVAGEVVFNTGMVGYPEAMTDPSYRGQLLVLTYPLIGNYGIPVDGRVAGERGNLGLDGFFESERIQVSGLIVSAVSLAYSHWSARDSLDLWMERHRIPGLMGVDTRALTKRLRKKGSMLGKMFVDGQEVGWEDPNNRNLVAEVSESQPRCYPGSGRGKVILVDLGCKYGIIRCLNRRGFDVITVPWDYDWREEEAKGVVISNGPGDPKMCSETIANIRRALEGRKPILGICLGHQLLALAAGADTYKLMYGHRGQNQPCIEVGTKRCYITSQNHGYAVNEQTLPEDWRPWFFNANDGTNEGMRHQRQPFFSVQFHPEAQPGPADTEFIFDIFADAVDHEK
jgi:carbamoyl-phosphate synthase small subunit